MSSPSAMSRCTPMMSARGTITSTMRRSRSPRMFLSMVRSAGEKPVSPAPSSSTSRRSARMVLDFQRKIARSVRVNQLSALSGATWLGRGSGTGRLRVALDVGIWHVEPGKDRCFEPFHCSRLVIGRVIVAGEMKESMHREVSEMMRKGFMLGARFTFRRLVGDYDITEQPGCSTSIARFLGGKGQHVGRCVFGTPIAVERPDCRIVGQHDSKLALDC